MLKKLLCLFLTAFLLCPVLSGLAEEAGAVFDPADAIIAEFEKITQIPRPSGYTDGISGYLAAWAEEKGFSVIRDETNNVIFDVPATAGMEDRPFTGLQVHMDMVFAQTDGGTLDPLTTPVTMINDGKFLRAACTSLGADDGIGVAIALCIAEGRMAHGPLRVFVTSDEETTFDGAKALDPALLNDVPFLINLDSEEEGYVTVSSAACIECRYTADASAVPLTYDTALEITVFNLTGGHSGHDIGKDRLNAIILLGNSLRLLEEKDIAFSLASMNGGAAYNAIPTSARATICLAGRDAERARGLLSDILTEQMEAHRESDPNGMFTIGSAPLPVEVMSPDRGKALLELICCVPNGCLSMSSDLEELIRTSSNLGVLHASDEGIEAQALIRSSDDAEINALIDQCRQNAEKQGFRFTDNFIADAWSFDPDSRLLALVKDAYQVLFGQEITVIATHAGLECGCLVKKSPGIDVVSIGPNIHDPHTVNECCEIDSFQRIWSLLEEIFQRIE